MALRDQPYIPLFADDYLTDEKLNMCSPSTQGVYIKIMCLFHKSDPYGGILLKQKDKQRDKQISNFACKLAKLLPFDLPVIESALVELIEEHVLNIDDDFLYQKRMVRDNELSVKRSKSGKKGGDASLGKKRMCEDQSLFATEFAQANLQANAEYEYGNENGNSKEGKEGVGEGGEYPPEESFQRTDPAPEIGTVLTIEQCHELCLANQRWLSALSKHKGIPLPLLETWLTKFLVDLKVKDILQNTLTDYKSHFVNWLKYQLKDGKDINKPPHTGSSEMRSGVAQRIAEKLADSN